MKELVAVLMLWLSAQTGYPVPEQPAIQFLSDETMQMEYRARAGFPEDVENIPVQAFYDKQLHLVTLHEGWDATDLNDVSTLVHELTHHMQNVAGAEFPCAGKGEAEAYALERKWLQSHGVPKADLYAVMGVDGMTLILATMCAEE